MNAGVEGRPGGRSLSCSWPVPDLGVSQGGQGTPEGSWGVSREAGEQGCAGVGVKGWRVGKAPRRVPGGEDPGAGQAGLPSTPWEGGQRPGGHGASLGGPARRSVPPSILATCQQPQCVPHGAHVSTARGPPRKRPWPRIRRRWGLTESSEALAHLLLEGIPSCPSGLVPRDTHLSAPLTAPAPVCLPTGNAFPQTWPVRGCGLLLREVPAVHGSPPPPAPSDVCAR